MGFSRQEYWSGLPLPTPEDLPQPKTEATSLASPALAGRFFTTSATWEAPLEAYPLLYIMTELCPPEIHIWKPSPFTVTAFGGTAFREVIKVK